jgi:thymidylate synthase (FAD)
MKLIEPKVELIKQENGLEGIYKQIERVGRTCYKSEDKITENSAKPFVDRMINSKHYAMLEHGTVYLMIPVTYSTIYEGDNYAGGTRVDWSLGSGERYINNKYSSYTIIHHNPNDIYPNIPTGYNFKGGIHKQYVTTNLRVLVENDWLDDLKYICDPVEHHVKRISLKFTTSIGVSREGNRHRSFSIAEQSTRYCNYSKDKFGGEITFCIPKWYDEHKYDSYKMNEFDKYLKQAEDLYMFYIDCGMQPQEAREVLPLSTATEVVYTGFEEDWKHFFDLRYRETTGKAHPNMKQIATMAHDLILKELNLDL